MNNPSKGLTKQIGLWSAISVVVGSIIGAGVFMKPAVMAEQLGSPVWLILVWIIAGLFSLFGALILSELGTMWPETGGLYTYFRKTFGDFFSFLYGWSAFAVINTAAVAAIAWVCARYANYFLHLTGFSADVEQSIIWHIPLIGVLYPLQDFGVKIIAIVIVTGLTILNYRSVKGGASFQLISTVTKLAVFAALIAGIFILGNGDTANFIHAESPPQGTDLLNGLVVAMTGAFFAYDGWINISFIAGEIRQPQRNIPRSLFAGVVICIAIYVLINLAYLYVLPVEEMAGSSLIASDAMSKVLGATSGAIIAAMIVICTLGAVNGNLMATSRVTYAMGKDQLFFRVAGKTSRFRSPGNALVFHAVWTCLFILTGTFDMLADMFVFITWLAYLLGAVAVLMLRRKMPKHERPYKTWGYPWVPVLFICFSFFYLLFTIITDINNYVKGGQPVINSLLGVLITLVGVPLYFWIRKRNTAAKTSE